MEQIANSVLVFSLGPVQSFIAEARRAADLFTGSTILSELAKAAAQAIGTGKLVYPASVEDVNVPNVLVACLPAEDAPSVVQRAQAALHQRWHEIADSAKRLFDDFADATFNEIWNRQLGNFWEIYWTIAEDTDDYTDAYVRARAALDALKRSRLFAPSEEPGIKDTLSGQREALHGNGQTSYHSVKSFWARIAQSLGPSCLRPEGRERLDAIGATKRFCEIATNTSFPSTSTVAVLDFIERAKRRALDALRAHRDAVSQLLGRYAYRPRDHDPDWPFDGDLLFEETFRPNRLEDSYALAQPSPQKLDAARQTLRALYKAVGDSPSTYYALLVFDGDDMGQRISKCLQQSNPRQAHTQLSRSLVVFAQRVRDIFKDAPECLIYNGGDDVMAFLPIEWALDKAKALASAFETVARQDAPVYGTASAGLVLVHHLHPLDAALRAARAAEAQAKQMPGKAALCITALKRSGEQVNAVTKWNDLDRLKLLVDSMKQGHLASSFVSDAMLNLEAIPSDSLDMLGMELRRQARRHGAEAWVKRGEADQLAEQLTNWADRLPSKAEDLRNWINIARFIVRESSAEAAH